MQFLYYVHSVLFYRRHVFALTLMLVFVVLVSTGIVIAEDCSGGAICPKP
jgi:hypothetical protein